MSIEKVPVFGAQPYGFKATDVSGCKMWLDASDLLTVFQMIPYNTTGIQNLTDSQRFLFWQDKSTGNHDMIRKVGPNSGYDSNEPISTFNSPYNILDNSPEFYGPSVSPATYGEAGPKITFTQYSGSNQNTYPEYLNQNLVAIGGYNGDIGGNPGPSGPRLGEDPVYSTEIFVVVKPTYLNAGGYVFSIGSKAGKAADFTSLAITSSGYWKISSQGGTRDVESSNPEVFNTFSNIRGPDVNYRLLSMSLSNTNYILRRNSVQIGSANKSWSPTLSNYQYVLGLSRVGTNTAPFDGSIAEVLVYDSILTTEKRTVVESYLANKWNLIDLLPSNHPARLQNTPIYLGGRSMAEEPNGFVRRALMIKIRTPPPPLLNAPTISFGAINIGWTSPANIFDIIIQQSSDDISFANYLTFLNQLLEPPTFSYNLVTGSEYGKYYKFRIRAKSGPLISAYATSVSVYAPYIPAVPSGLDTDSAINTFQMQWIDVGGIGYGTATNYSIQIYRYFDDAYTLIETILTNDTTSYEYPIEITSIYTFKVAGRNAIGQSAYSDYGTNRSIEYIPPF